MTAASGPRHQDAGTSVGPAAPWPPMRWRRVFPGEERQLSILRRWLESLLPDHPARADVASAATELGANAIQHTASGHGGSFAVEITWHQQAVRVAVADSGGPAEPRVINDPAAEHGRGMLLVQGLSVRTGITGDRRGRLIWADIPWTPTEATPPLLAQDPHETALEADQATLTSHFTGTPAWFGRSTLHWWALANGHLLTAPSARQLAALLDRALATPPLRTNATAATATASARTAPAARHEHRPAEPAPRVSPGPASAPRSERDDIDFGGRSSPRTPSRKHRPGSTARQIDPPISPGRPATAAS
jgi:Histidine kinase-like ATPase domain